MAVTLLLVVGEDLATDLLEQLSLHQLRSSSFCSKLFFFACIAFKSCTVMLITKNWLFLTLWFSFQRAKDGHCWGSLHRPLRKIP